MNVVKLHMGKAFAVIALMFSIVLPKMVEFGTQLARAEIGLFYYAGHGMQVEGRNYLIPLGVDIQSEDDIKFESIDVGRVLAKMEWAQNPVNIIVLDACRNNPFERGFRSAERGLARVESPSQSSRPRRWRLATRLMKRICRR